MRTVLRAIRSFFSDWLLMESRQLRIITLVLFFVVCGMLGMFGSIIADYLDLYNRFVTLEYQHTQLKSQQADVKKRLYQDTEKWRNLGIMIEDNFVIVPVITDTTVGFLYQLQTKR